MNSASPRILLVSTTWWPSDARLAAALRDAGCAVSVLCPRGHPVEALRIDAVIRLRPSGRARQLERAIAAARPDLVVPTDERALRDLHELHGQAGSAERALIERSLGSPDTFGRLTKRLTTMEDARAAGLHVAETIAVTDRAALGHWVQENAAPIVLKSDGSSGGEGVRVCRSARSIDAALAALRRGPGAAVLLKRWLVNRDRFILVDRVRRQVPALVAQRHVQGRAGDFAAFCFRGEILGFAVGQQEQRARLQGPSTMLRLLDHPDLVDGARRLVANLGLTGFIGIDIIIEDATGRAVVIEINPRATPLCGAAVGPGSPTAGVAGALRGSVSAPASRRSPRTLLAYFPAAWKVEPIDERLAACGDDIPHGDPALLAELLRTPWPERGALARGLSAFLAWLGPLVPAWLEARHLPPIGGDTASAISAASREARQPSGGMSAPDRTSGANEAAEPPSGTASALATSARPAIDRRRCEPLRDGSGRPLQLRQVVGSVTEARQDAAML